ncbi:hypothetical protein NM688_g5948 [Phlebia brevispora]|uniref:Uncharacterized protein n=1 Tax=Phlebia brevispora TaxID=194682 RepID=A0ACC1SMA6_9APHY|nr:hypothetical protein NM688_g5948 [Phlebia brevispora]
MPKVQKKVEDAPEVQQRTCRARTTGLHIQFRALPPCVACSTARSGDSCRFLGSRYIDAGKTQFQFPPDPRGVPSYREHARRFCCLGWKMNCNTALNHTYSTDAESYLYGQLAASVFQLRVDENNEDGTVQTIVQCQAHSNTEFAPITRFDHDNLVETAAQMRQLINGVPYQFPPQEMPKDETVVPRLWVGKHELDDFLPYLGSGIPVVVPNAAQHLQGYWTPQDFIDRHRQEKVMLTDCETGYQKASTIGDYFQSLLGRRTADPGIWKLKDWPPTETFEEVFPDLFEAFRRGVPFPDLSAVDGIFNLAAHFAVNGKMPDLGPKMYIAYGTEANDDHHGSTRLHLDLTDAVNIMTWAAPKADGTPGGAIWTIWPSAYREQLREFLLTDVNIEHNVSTDGDPIHCQKYYLGPSLLTHFYQRYHIRPYTIFQRAGEAVFIPAGCPHQVSNCTDAIKVACDFLSVSTLSVTQTLADELRAHRLLTGEGTDVLQLFTTLLHAWESLRHTFETAEEEQEVSRQAEVVHEGRDISSMRSERAL